MPANMSDPRCENFGIPCQGYAEPKSSKRGKSSTRTERLLLPRPKLQAASVPVTCATLAPAPAPIGPVTLSQTSTIPDADLAAAMDLAALPLLLITLPALPFAWAPDDNHYWRLFTDHVVEGLSPHFDADGGFWRRTLPREGMASDCIRHAILSVGAYCRAAMDARDEQDHNNHSNTVTMRGFAALANEPVAKTNRLWVDTRRTAHHRAALKHYTKAMECLRESMGGSETARLTMMATLLFIVFENMQGNYHAAGSLIRSGLKVLASATREYAWANDKLHAAPGYDAATSMSDASASGESLASSLSGTPPPMPPPPPASPISALFYQPQTQQPTTHQQHNPSQQLFTPSLLSGRTTWAPATHTGSSDAEVAEMTQMFARQSIVCAHLPFPHCKYAYHLLLPSSPTDAPVPNRYLPAYPATLAEARAAWDFYLPKLGGFWQKAAWQNMNRGFRGQVDGKAVRREQEGHLEWLVNFGTLLDSLELVEGVEDVEAEGSVSSAGKHPAGGAGARARSIALLRMHHTIAQIFTTCCLDPTEMLYDRYTGVFARVLGDMRSFVSSSNNKQDNNSTSGGSAASRPTDPTSYTNDISLLPFLGFIVAKCRARSIRQSALALLANEYGDRREGCWDSRSLTNGMTGLVGLEKMGGVVPVVLGNDGGEGEMEIPAESRWVWTNAVWNLEARTMTVEYTRCVPDGEGRYERTGFPMGL
jgi:hypothetical protein